MYVVLDTNILHQEGLISRNMQRLERIAKTGRLKVCVPSLVLREFVTKKVSDTLDVLSKSHQVLHELPKKLPGSAAADFATAMLDLHSAFEGEIENDYNKAVQDWVGRLQVDVLEYGAESVRQVFEDYFSGAGAFRARKKRDDIPDAFIAYSILPLIDRGGNVAVIVKDGVLKNYFKSMDRLAVYDGLAEYFEADPFKRLSEEIDTSTRNVEEIKALLTSVGAIEQLTDFIRNDKDGLAYIYVEEEGISGVDVLGMPAYGVSVNGTRPEHVTKVTLTQSDFVDAGFFSIALEIVAYSGINYVADYMDFSSLQPPRDTEVEMSSMNGEGWAELSEVRKVLLKGFVQVKFDPHWSAKELKPHMRYLKSENSAIQIEIEINSAVLM